jgi:hypothetical protein
MMLRRSFILIAAIWAISLPVYIMSQLIDTPAYRSSVLYTHHDIWIKQDELGKLKFIPTSDPELQDDLPRLANEIDYWLTYQYSPRASSGLFRKWNSVTSPSYFRINRIDASEFNREEILSLFLIEAETRLAQPNPPEAYTDLRDIGALQAIRTNRPVVFERHPANIALDLLSVLWGLGSIILAFIFIGVIFSKLVPNETEPRCQHCSYAIDGLPTDLCPECGRHHSLAKTP